MAKTETTKKEETKAQRFSRLASARTGKALTAIRLLEPLAAKSNYEYTSEQVSKITGALQSALDHVRDVYAGKAVVGKAGFQV